MKSIFDYLLVYYRLRNTMTHNLFTYDVGFKKHHHNLFFFLTPNSQEEYESAFFMCLWSRPAKEAIFSFLTHHFTKSDDKQHFLIFLKQECLIRISIINQRKQQGFYLKFMDFVPRLEMCLEWVELQIQSSYQNLQLESIDNANDPTSIKTEFCTSNTSVEPLKNNNFSSEAVSTTNTDKEKKICAIDYHLKHIFAEQRKIKINGNKINHFELIYLIYAILYLKDEKGNRFFDATQDHIALILSFFEVFTQDYSTVLTDYAGVATNISKQNRHNLVLNETLESYHSRYFLISRILLDKSIISILPRKKNGEKKERKK